MIGLKVGLKSFIHGALIALAGWMALGFPVLFVLRVWAGLLAIVAMVILACELADAVGNHE